MSDLFLYLIAYECDIKNGEHEIVTGKSWTVIKDASRVISDFGDKSFAFYSGRLNINNKLTFNYLNNVFPSTNYPMQFCRFSRKAINSEMNHPLE